MRENATIDHQEPPFPDDPGPTDYATPAHTTRDDIPPHSIPAEQNIIGAALQSNDAFNTLAKRVQPHHFYGHGHELIWQSLQTLAADDQPVEPTALLADLQTRKLLSQVGGALYLHTLYASYTTLSAADYYADQVLDHARRRKGIETLQRELQRLRDPAATDTRQALQTAADAVTDALDDITNPNPTTTWTPVDIQAALNGQILDPPPEMCTRSDGINLFYTGAIHTVSGESESGKTWFTLLAAVQLLTIGMNVVFIDFEDRAERVIGRLKGLGATNQQIAAHFSYIRPDRPLSTVSQHELAPHLEHAMLVIIDGVTEAMSVHGFDLNSNEDAAKFFGILPRWIADHGPAVVMIDHVVKDKEKQGRYALGAQHKLAGIDGAAYTVKVITAFGRGKRGMARVDVAKDRPGHVREHAHGDRIAEFTLDDTTPGGMVALLEPPSLPTNLDDGSWAPTILMEKISKYIYGNPNCSTRSIFDAVPGKDAHKRQALELLVRRTHVRVEKGPRNSNLHHHVSAFPPIVDDPDEPTSSNPWEASS